MKPLPAEVWGSLIALFCKIIAFLFIVHFITNTYDSLKDIKDELKFIENSIRIINTYH